MCLLTLSVEYLKRKYKDVVQSLLNVCIYGVLFFDPHRITHTSNIGVRPINTRTPYPDMSLNNRSTTIKFYLVPSSLML